VGPSCRRERGGGAGWAGSGRSRPAGFPGVAQVAPGLFLLFFYFFLLLSFSFVLNFCLSFEKALLFRFE
jgi:hypothetical protein